MPTYAVLAFWANSSPTIYAPFATDTDAHSWGLDVLTRMPTCTTFQIIEITGPPDYSQLIEGDA